MKRALYIVACLAGASCTTPPPISASASCLEKQNFCLDQCKGMHSGEQLASIIAMLAVRPKTQQQKENLQQSNAQDEKKQAAEKSQCRTTCDTKATVCRSNIQ